MICAACASFSAACSSPSALDDLWRAVRAPPPPGAPSRASSRAAVTSFTSTADTSMPQSSTALGETEMDELARQSRQINAILRQIIDKRSEDWGIEVSASRVKDVDLPPEMKRAMARQAEAERERRAKVINAEGELQPPRSWRRPRISSAASRRRSSSAISRRSTKSPRRIIRPRFSPSRSICSGGHREGRLS